MASPTKVLTLDGNEAAASVAYRLSEVIAIYPITPSSTMGELSDEWSAKNKTNIWGLVPKIMEMQSEAGAAAACHGAVQAGTLSTTFTASQGLLLMIPNLYKIAGELTPFVLHVTARTLATHALSIFGDHSDVMACRQTGVALLCSNNVQEAHDMALIAHAASLRSRIPFMHFFDGFRTSHEVSKISMLSDDNLRAMIDENAIQAHRSRALTPDHPVVRGTAQNPDAFFQAREACNEFYTALPACVKEEMAKLAKITGRTYDLFEYVGDPQATKIIVVMGSGAETVEETVKYMVDKGEKVGVLKVRLYRPWSLADFAHALPKSVQRIAVLDRTKEPGAIGEPLYQDVVTALVEANRPGIQVIGGRYGLSSKEFTPAMVKAVFDEVDMPQPIKHFTVGIKDDVTHLSLDYDEKFGIESEDTFRGVFFGVGADGTVGANKNSIKIIGEETDNFAQGYFVYDSKKSGAMTISHLRFGPRPIRAPYLVGKNSANFVACSQFGFLEKVDVVSYCKPGGILLLNSPYPADSVWNQLTREVQQEILDKKVQMYVIDAFDVAKKAEMGVRTNTIMQACFFGISGVLPKEQAIEQIKKSIRKTYEKKGEGVIQKNFTAVDMSLSHLHEVVPPTEVTSKLFMPLMVPDSAPDFVKRVTGVMLAGQGDLLPVSAFPIDGTWPLGTTKWEKRALASEIPVWEKDLCIQCNKCAMVCPHSAIRAKTFDPHWKDAAPATFKTMPYKAADFKGQDYTIQVSPDDCTGCDLCVAVCPAADKKNPDRKALNMAPTAPLRTPETDNFNFFLKLPEVDRTKVRMDVKGSQLLQPLFEFSGACSGCGETPYVKLITQLFGDRAVIANATGCSSIFGGNLPTTPYCQNEDGRGPAWANSLFEDNAEFGLGIRLGLDDLFDQARYLVKKLSSQIGETLATAILTAEQSDETMLAAQRQRITELRKKLATVDGFEPKKLSLIADYLARKSVWIVGGDGWAYDIGFGGVDHVLWSGKNVNMLVLDTEVYSNTGGQQSKSTPMGAAARFAVAGKSMGKKDLGLIAMTFGHVYVARVALGAKDVQTVKAIMEAESYPGPSLVIAYSHCIAHGYDLANGISQQRLAVDSGAWPLYRFDPRRHALGEPELQLDSPAPKVPLADFLKNENRFRIVQQQDPERYAELLALAQKNVHEHYALYQKLATKTETVKAETAN